MKLVPDWKRAWRWFSVQAFAALLALPFVWTTLPADVKAMIPEKARPYLVMLIAAGGLAGRVIDQNKAPPA